MEFLVSPPVAFLIYIPLVLLILWAGRQLAGPEVSSENKSRIYSSGEEAPTYTAAPGYRPFFLVALFFAILHLGMLVLGLSDLSGTSAFYLGGLAIGLVALLLG
jgi:NADH:ubiquinone oxidoreductase subunit 3 (subunit A)